MNESIENLPSVWFRPKITFLQIQRIFRDAKEIIRIASGFFTVRGWNLIREFTRGKRVLILVGITEPSEGEAQKVLVQEIMSGLATSIEQNRRQAVEELVERIRQGEYSPEKVRLENSCINILWYNQRIFDFMFLAIKIVRIY